MGGNFTKGSKQKETEIDFEKVQDVIYWAKKWEVSPHQIMEAYGAINSNSVSKIEEYLRNRGFAI